MNQVNEARMDAGQTGQTPTQPLPLPAPPKQKTIPPPIPIPGHMTDIMASASPLSPRKALLKRNQQDEVNK